MAPLTDEEKREQMTQRNAAICAYYLEGHKLSVVASRFGLGRQRVQQILQGAGVWKPYVKGKRQEHLGVKVSEETKIALKQEAERQGVTVSQLTDDILNKAMTAE